MNQPYGAHPVLSNPVPIITKYPCSCLYCGKIVSQGSMAWWDPGHGVVHEECFGKRLDDNLAFSLMERRNLDRSLAKIARTGKADVDVPEKFAIDIDAGKKRIEEVRKKMGWPSEHN